ncbi:MAG TPA: hypothetical protein VNU97_08280 [Rhizomicrobium sp.]|nr:hypothetical protein [Rhizomicrobium sp.]
MAHQTRNWHAVEVSDFGGGNLRLMVTGEFQSLRSNEVAHLKEAVPQGINAHVLILDMAVEASGTGSDIVVWKHVTPFAKPVSPRQYSEVWIQHDGTSKSVKVEVVLS